MIVGITDEGVGISIIAIFPDESSGAKVFRNGATALFGCCNALETGGGGGGVLVLSIFETDVRLKILFSIVQNDGFESRVEPSRVES